jgi:hypothetical protein
LATVLLPEAMPPVRPTKIIVAEHSMRVATSQPASFDFSWPRLV